MAKKALGLVADEVLDQISDAVIMTDLDGTIVYWNKPAEKMYGWTADEVLGEPAADILQTEFFSGDREHALEVISSRGTWREDVVQYHRSGQRLLVAASVKLVFDEDDRPIGRIAVNRDMTRVRELERDVLRVAKLESVAFVAGGVAHDVKNMLSGAMGLAELINRRLSDKPSAKLARQLKQSLREAAALTERMVSYSRKGSLNIESMCLNARLEAIDQLLRRLLPETVELVVERCSDSLPVRFERGQFDQIVMNLVVNARDALPDGGTISISTERVESESDPGVYCAEIAVRDDGCGIDEDTRDQIFEPYFTTKPAGIGSGFGLATVRDIVRRYHGTIEVESEPGEGTTFTLRLPLVPSAQSEITRRG